MKTQEVNENVPRPPVVVVVGHIDHGKSTLLDYIRKTNVAEGEVGGITQRISAYEVSLSGPEGGERKITFLDTPGHEAFSKMRECGCRIADVAVLVVSAEDGPKPQTIEAWKTISEAGIPCVVALSKADKPGANVEKVKAELSERGIYLEDYGGKTPSVPISSKTGAGVDELLSLIALSAEMENLSGSPEKEASGFVLEANLDRKRGIQATLVIKDGTLTKGMAVVSGGSVCTVNILEDFQGRAISEASFSSPVRLVGFSEMPRSGAPFESFANRKKAEKRAEALFRENAKNGNFPSDSPSAETKEKKVIPILLKADTAGALEAAEKEIQKIQDEKAEFKIVQKGVGRVAESDIKIIAGGENVLVVGFNVDADKSALELAEKRGMATGFFDVIYKMSEWLAEEMEKRRPKIEVMESSGQAKMLKTFSRTKERQIVGGRVIKGVIASGGTVRVLRREAEIGRGKIIGLEKSKVKTKEVEEGAEFGAMLESKVEIAPGDVLEAFYVTER